VSVRPWLLSGIHIWVHSFWNLTILENQIQGQPGTLLKEQGSSNFVWNMGHKRPVLRPRCTGTGRTQTQILFYSIIFYSILFYSALFCSILLYSALFYSVLFYSILLYSILFYSILFYSTLLYSTLLYSILFYRMYYLKFFDKLQKWVLYTEASISFIYS
jgi:hypothetical protein